MKNSFRMLAAASAFACLAFAVDTKTWSQDDYAEFEKGSLKKLSLSSDGRLALAPAFREVYDSASVYLWALAEDSHGNVYAGGGGPGGPGARLYMIPPKGKARTVAQLDDFEIHSVAIDKQDRVYAATSPDGKIYRIDNDKPHLFFDPHAKYIWGMAFDSRGNLFVATGDRGEIFKVDPQGKGDVFYATGETHARSLAVDAKDNLIVGTEPGGLIVRVSPKGEGFVLYQAPKREITAVAVARDGSIFAAGVGNKTGAATSMPVGMPPAPQPSPMPGQTATAPAPRPAPVPPSAPASIPGGSDVYRIYPDGFPRKVWSHAQNIAYAIGFDRDGKPLVGTGNKGTIYRLDDDRVYTDLLNAPPTQVTYLLAGRNGDVYAATGNIGKVYRIGPGTEGEGFIESQVFDAGMFSYWGRLSFQGAANGGALQIEARTGNLDRPQKDWSPWSAAITSPDGARVSAPAARFLQWRATLKSAGGQSPELRSVDVAYLTKNVAPVVGRIEITPPNYKFPPQSLTITPSQNITLPPLGQPQRTAPALGISSGSSSTMQYAKGFLGARWTASDDNEDSLEYTVEIKGEKEATWKPLKDKLHDKAISFDSTAYPDGWYRVRVTATDAPSNPPAGALKAELTSDPFLIDNTAPQIDGLASSVSAGKVSVRWKAADALSTIDHCEYSVNGGEWTVVEPTTRLSDSHEHEYNLTLDTAQAEETVAVRVTDSFENQAVAKTIVQR